MKRSSLAILLLSLGLGAAAVAAPTPKPARPEPAPAPAAAAPAPAATAAAPAWKTPGKGFAKLWSLPVKTLDGKPGSLASYQGKAILVVNVASKCGLTPQYAALEALQKRYADRGFTVVGFPCNQFGGQEPGSAEEIKTFCSSTYGVTFPLFEKLEVNGKGRHPIYKLLTRIDDGAGEAGDIQWNFEKFVIAADGKRVIRFRPQTTPDDPSVIAAIEAALPAPAK
jgi:glutathione peroxidase